MKDRTDCGAQLGERTVAGFSKTIAACSIFGLAICTAVAPASAQPMMHHHMMHRHMMMHHDRMMMHHEHRMMHHDRMMHRHMMHRMMRHAM